MSHKLVRYLTPVIQNKLELWAVNCVSVNPRRMLTKDLQKLFGHLMVDQAVANVEALKDC